MTRRNQAINSILAISLTLPVAFAEAGTTASNPCDGGIVTLRPGADLDLGWSGDAHDLDLSVGAIFSYDVVRRCTDNQAECTVDEDCGNKTCNPTCDCETDTKCDISGPADSNRCLDGLAECTTNADCPSSGECTSIAGPPVSVAVAGTPLCFVAEFDTPVTGSIDTDSGDVALTTTLRWRAYLGVSEESPCPRCGAPDDEPQLGESFTCEGGPNDGDACTVDAATSAFGGVSYDCAPDADDTVTGTDGILMPLPLVTTDETSRTAALPCGFFGFTGNPTSPGSNPKCTDKTADADPVCASNADCKRCTANSDIACTNNGDCTGSGFCAESPDQPITCGYWCHCGFCNGDASLPCFESSDCPDGQACEAGTSEVGPGQRQQRPNDCSEDFFICGTESSEECGDSSQPCFGPTIERAGEAVPIGSYCSFTGDLCTINADCEGDGDFCAFDVLTPRLSGLFCSQASTNPAINAGIGITGPGAIDWSALIQICRCGDPEPACEIFCEGGEPAPLCGDANENGAIQTSDALRALQKSVGQNVSCPLVVCDVNDNGQVQTSDALSILRKSVGQSVTLTCPSTT